MTNNQPLPVDQPDTWETLVPGSLTLEEILASLDPETLRDLCEILGRETG